MPLPGLDNLAMGLPEKVFAEPECLADRTRRPERARIGCDPKPRSIPAATGRNVSHPTRWRRATDGRHDVAADPSGRRRSARSRPAGSFGALEPADVV